MEKKQTWSQKKQVISPLITCLPVPFLCNFFFLFTSQPSWRKKNILFGALSFGSPPKRPEKKLTDWNCGTKKVEPPRPERRGVHLIDNKRPRKGGNCHQRRLNISPEHFTLRCSTNLIVFCFFQFGWLSAAIGFKCSHTSFSSDYSWLEVDYP